MASGVLLSRPIMPVILQLHIDIEMSLVLFVLTHNFASSGSREYHISFHPGVRRFSPTSHSLEGSQGHCRSLRAPRSYAVAAVPTTWPEYIWQLRFPVGCLVVTPLTSGEVGS